MRFRPEFRRSVRDIFHELSDPFTKGKINPKCAVSADLVTLGDSWLNFAIGKGLVEPVIGAEEQDWFQDLSDKWKVRMQCTFSFSLSGFCESTSRSKSIPVNFYMLLHKKRNSDTTRNNLLRIQITVC